jgi:hypothetical protein
MKSHKEADCQVANQRQEDRKSFAGPSRPERLRAGKYV